MTRKKHSPLLDFVTTRAWALEENVLTQLTQLVVQHANGVRVAEEDVEAVVAARDAKKPARKADYEMQGSTAVIPISGVIAKHASQVNGDCQPQGTATTAISAMLKQALADDAVKGILFAVDSPGGSIDGVQALADEIYAARGKKPMTSLADGMMASAAYWIASQADQVLATADAAVGSIGVYSVIGDLSRLYKNEGVDVHVVKNGALKGAGMRGTPVTSDQVAAIQATVDSYAELFHAAVMRGRGMSEKRLSAITDGSVHIGAKAKAVGLIDGIANLETAMATLGSAGAVAASAEPLETIPEAIAAQPQPSAEETSEENHMTLPSNAAPAPSAELTAEAVTQGHPKAAEALHAAGAQAERNRISAIRALGSTGQETLVEKLVADGSSETDALKALHADLKGRQGQGLKALIDAAPKSAGSDAPVATFSEKAAAEKTAPVPLKADGKRDWLAEAQADFVKTPQLRHEYGDAETLAKWREGAAAGAFGPQAKREASV